VPGEQNGRPEFSWGARADARRRGLDWRLAPRAAKCCQSRGGSAARPAPFISCYDINVPGEKDLSLGEYRGLAEFRRQIRRFLHFSETLAREHGIEPQQHQLLLAVHGLPEGVKPTIREIASRLFIQHHSAVELVNRLETTGAIARQVGSEDRREVWVRLTPAGRALLRKLAIAHRNELEKFGPELARALQSVLRQGRRNAA
jgi:DNA-binding MarR family transcriptional regulator